VTWAPNTTCPAYGAILGYYKPKESGRYQFWVTGTNIGARLFVDDILLLGGDALFPQAQLNLKASALLKAGVVYRVEMIIFSSVTLERAYARNDAFDMLVSTYQGSYFEQDLLDCPQRPKIRDLRASEFILFVASVWRRNLDGTRRYLRD
jgi:hypothetical protein